MAPRRAACPAASGTVREFDLADLAGDFGCRYAGARYEPFQGQPVLVADAVQRLATGP